MRSHRKHPCIFAINLINRFIHRDVDFRDKTNAPSQLEACSDRDFSKYDPVFHNMLLVFNTRLGAGR